MGAKLMNQSSLFHCYQYLQKINPINRKRLSYKPSSDYESISLKGLAGRNQDPQLLVVVEVEFLVVIAFVALR